MGCAKGVEAMLGLVGGGWGGGRKASTQVGKLLGSDPQAGGQLVAFVDTPCCRHLPPAAARQAFSRVPHMEMISLKMPRPPGRPAAL